MSISLMRKHLNEMGILKLRQPTGRNYIPMAGPPRFPMSSAQRLIIGCGSLVVMMIIPFYCLFSLPRWSRMHLGLPPAEEEQAEEPTPQEAHDEKDQDKDKKEEKKK
ncbi:uncharacterized protein LOC6529816 [Drosophila yakuba]|uniref:Uncharacterized protein n=1 Tax=Drosophila yakuba TaxID=7245 RepID=B4PBJ6_DROYA|nr:uncharacterized protein LOC6529816 [Drosophila yakuba]EDW90510.1 uncharacterized protein Dyak_GE13303 [Drosophila yakuba]